MAGGTAARAAALDILRRVRTGQRFDAAHAAAVEGLGDADRRLAHQIAAGVLRARSELDRRLRPLVSRDWSRTAPDLKDLLRVGTYQLTHLDRVPKYAAVQATVEVAKQLRGSRGAGLVNAVLRRVADGEPPEQRHRAISEAHRLAESYSHPGWLVERWTRQFGAERTRALLEHNNRRPPLVTQPVRWSVEKLRHSFRASGVAFADAPCGAGLVVEGGRVENLPGYHEGGFVVQDAAQARLLEFAAVPNDSLVWDACASPGGKAAVLSRRGPVIATEFRRDRIARLRDTLTRAAPDVPVLVADARHPPVNATSVDVTLVDVPCSATGALSRHPDGRWRLSEDGITRMAGLQAELLNGASTAVRPGAVLVYLTCSLEPEENRQQVDRFLERHPGFERDREDLLLFPPDTGTDGGFGARLTRMR